MSLVNTCHILQSAVKGNYAVPAFNCYNLDIINMVITAAENLKSPVIISAQEKGLQLTGFQQYAAVVRAYAEAADIPVALHLDHGKSLETVEKCLKAGFTSVMYDGSHLPLYINIERTAAMVVMAEKYGASTEGELGVIPGSEAGQEVALEEQKFTDPEEAEEFVRCTGVSALAVSIGTIHYMQEKMITPDLALLKTLKRKIAVPLVLHGGAAVTEDMVRRLVVGGINKYNINFYLNRAFISGMQAALHDFSVKTGDGRMSVPMVDIFRRVEEKVRKEMSYRIKLLGSGGKSMVDILYE